MTDSTPSITLTHDQQRALKRGTPMVGQPRAVAGIDLDVDHFLRQADAFARTCPRYQTTNLRSNIYLLRADALTAGFKTITAQNVTAVFYALRSGSRQADKAVTRRTR